MLKQILLFCFFISIVSSCKCNKDGKPVTDTTTTTATDQTTTTDGTNTAATNTDSIAAANAAANANNAANASNGSSESNGKSLFKKGKGSDRSANNTKGYFPEGSERALTDKDLEFLSAWGYDVMKNEIYARHGMIFPDGMLKDHFERQPWYHAKSTNVRASLTSLEKSNIRFMENYKDKPIVENGD